LTPSRTIDVRGVAGLPLPCDPVLLEALAETAREWAAGDLTRLQCLLGAFAYRLGAEDTRDALRSVLVRLGIDPDSVLGEFGSDPRPPRKKNHAAVKMKSRVKIPDPKGPPPDCLF
jgi:hypothetical protein